MARPDPTLPPVTLVEAGVDVRPDGELWGALVVRLKDGSTKLYAQCLPQIRFPDPPGWDAIAELTGVTADDVLHGWSDDDRSNEAADRAFTQLREFGGQTFFVRERAGVDGERAIDLIPIRIEDPAMRIDLDEGRIARGGEPNAEPPIFARVLSISASVDPNDLVPPTIVITTDGAQPFAIQVPDADHQTDPPDWFFVESIAGASATKVAYGWTRPAAQKQNVHLNRAIGALIQALTVPGPAPTDPRLGRFVPITADGRIDLDALRRELIRERLPIRPMIFVGRNPIETARRAWLLLKDTIGHHLFRYNVERGANSGVPAVVRAVEGQMKLEVLDTKEKVRSILFGQIDFCGSGKGTVIRQVTPPDVVSQHMGLFADQSVAPIDTLVRIPVMRRDGSIHDTEGYDPKSRVWYAPELRLEPIPNRPTEADIRAAYGAVMAPFVDFPFVQETGGRAAAIACLFDQILRSMIAGPRPIYVFDAPPLKGQGTGKTLLARAIGTIITGRDIEVTGWPDDPKEFPKTITSKLLAAEPFIIFDNLEGVVRHKDLAACATSTMWSSRLLHTNETPRLPMTATIALTLNGARFSPDIARRTITIRLDAKMVDPFRRKADDFKIPFIIPWCLQHRATVIRACLLLARAWVLAGRPKDDRLAVGSFEAWQAVTGGILRFAGFTDLPLALEESRARDVDSAEHDEFIMRWATVQAGPLSAAQLANLAEEAGLYASVLEKVKSPVWRGRHMAEILRKMEGHVFAGGFKVERCDHRISGNFVYQLQRITPGGANGAAGEAFFPL